MGKKNLDKLFYEKLSKFSETPDEKVWQSINTSLDKKKKSRKIIPIWWKLGGVAAVLAIALYIMNPLDDKKVVSPTVTEIKPEENNTNSSTKENKVIEGFEKLDPQIVSTDEEDSSKENISSQKGTSTKTVKSNQNSKEKTSNFKSQLDKTAIQLANENTEKQNLKKPDNSNPSINTKSVLKKTSNMVVATQNANDSKKFIEKNNSDESISSESDKQNNLSSEKETDIAQIKKGEASDEKIDGAKKKSIFDEIAKQDEEKEALVENKGGKWSAGPSVAPVYFDAMGEGSPVHSIFVPNSKSGDLNLSYGLSIAYEINNKLKIRSGVHRVDYGYSTDDVEFSSSIESSAIGQITNVNYSATGKNIVVASSVSENSSVAINDIAPIAEDFSGQGLSQNGSMTQQFGYLEVPVELEYALVDNKLGVNIIGGISSLFLVDNSISLSAGELTTEMGEANNVNNVNFSTNVGIGLNYKFTSKVQLNVEPVFKYQLNTFSQTDGTFQPFTVGIYSGVSFKF